MWARDERDDQAPSLHPLDGQIAGHDAQFIPDSLVDGDLEPVADDVRHILSLPYESFGKYDARTAPSVRDTSGLQSSSSGASGCPLDDSSRNSATKIEPIDHDLAHLR